MVYTCVYICMCVCVCMYMYVSVYVTFSGIVSKRLARDLGRFLVEGFIAHWIPYPEYANFHKACFLCSCAD